MDRNIYDNDFEAFLKQKSDQYKMYPSDRVWGNIYSSLHGRKKWWALGLSLFILGAGLMVGREMLLADYSKISRDINNGNQGLTKLQAIPRVASVSAASASSSASRSGESTNGKSAVTKNTTTSFSGNRPSTLSPAATITTSVKAGGIDENAATVFITAPAPATENAIDAVLPTSNVDLLQPADVKPSKAFSLPAINAAAAESKDPTTKPATNLYEEKKTAPVKYSPWSLQLYASPTISYRRLTTLNTKGDSYIPVASNTSGNINNYVHHKPATGFELGTNVQYQLSGSLSVFAGAQLNYSRYYIDAFKYRTEKASIALNNSLLHDTLSGYTDIRNFSGYAPEQLQNKYLQLSLPVGIEIKLLGNKKLQFNIAGGVQPTFLLTSNSYLISTDYKNYIKSPNLVRGFNVHTNFEAFISYKTGGLKWQVGPQFRSQLLSSYTNEYRVREYLTEYGIKFGVSRSF